VRISLYNVVLNETDQFRDRRWAILVDGSLLAIRELNVRREFDGAKLLFRPEGWSVDAFRDETCDYKDRFL
jgi:hypothetical protein